MNLRAALLGLSLAGGATVSATPAEAFDFACCCHNNCPEGQAVCIPHLFLETCDATNAGYCRLSPAEPTQDPGLVHPYFFFYHMGFFYGFSVPCADLLGL